LSLPRVDHGWVIQQDIETAIVALASVISRDITVIGDMTVIQVLEIVQKERKNQVPTRLEPLDETINQLDEDDENDTVENVLGGVLSETLWKNLIEKFKTTGIIEKYVDVQDVGNMIVIEFIEDVWAPYKSQSLPHVIAEEWVKLVMGLTNESIWLNKNQSESFRAESGVLWDFAWSFNMSTGQPGESNEDGSDSTLVSNRFIRESLSIFQAMCMQENIIHVMSELGEIEGCEMTPVNSSLMIRSFSAAINYIGDFCLNRPERFIGDCRLSGLSVAEITALTNLTNKKSRDANRKTTDRRTKKVFFIYLLDDDDDRSKLTEALGLFRFFDPRT
jgi:hypothetical protein